MPGDAKQPKGEVATPESQEGQTPEQTETLTKKEAEAQIAKAVNAVKTDVGRLTAELRRSQEIANAAINRLKEKEEADYRQQEEANRDNPDELTRIRRRREIVEKEAKLAEREAKVQTQLTRIIQTTAKALEGQYNVSAETLLKYASEDVDAMEELAKSYGERKPSGESETKSIKRMTESPDDGKTKGGGKGLTKADAAKMSPKERHERAAEIAAISF